MFQSIQTRARRKVNLFLGKAYVPVPAHDPMLAREDPMLTMRLRTLLAPAAENYSSWPALAVRHTESGEERS